MQHDLNLKETKLEWHGSLQAYVIGFFCSLVLTAASFSIVGMKLLEGYFLIVTLVGLALVQAIVQLLFFLHLGQEEKPYWESVIFYFMVLVLLIIAIGSLWIMYDLNERVMSGMQMEMAHD